MMNEIGPIAQCPFCHHEVECTKFGMFDQRLWKCLCGSFAAGGVTGGSDYARASDEIIVRLKLAPPEEGLAPTDDYLEVNRRMKKALARDGYEVRFADVGWQENLVMSLIWVMKVGAELLPLNNWDQEVDVGRQPRAATNEH